LSRIAGNSDRQTRPLGRTSVDRLDNGRSSSALVCDPRDGRAVSAARSIAFALILGYAGTAFAYVGPGAGLPLIGMLVALIMAVLLAVVGFVWFPVRRLLRDRKAKRTASDESEDQVERPDREEH
jgi:Flp pilus assembly protein TadB